MKYWVKSDYSGYYESLTALDVTDIEVTARPYPFCEWDGAAWTYPIAGAREYQRAKVLADMDTEFYTALASNGINLVSLLGIVGILGDRTAYADDTGRSQDEIPFMKGYGAQLTYTMAQVATDIDTFFIPVASYLGKALAQKMRRFGEINTETDGETVLTYNWVAIL